MLWRLGKKFQENEAARTNDPWCISTLKRLQDASPLSLKVSLRSVSLTIYLLSSILKAIVACIYVNFPVMQIREGRFQTLDQCLIREYRMSIQGISKQITGDFCEVESHLVIILLVLHSLITFSVKRRFIGLYFFFAPVFPY